jgi:hypothetical protein
MPHEALLAASAPLAAGRGVRIDWHALGVVAAVSSGFAITIIVLFSVGVVGLSWYRGPDAPADSAGSPGSGALAATPAGAQPLGGARRAVGAAVALVCFAICAAAALYGLWLMIPQFH